MTPGTYIRLRREAAGKTIDEVALGTETTPPVSARRRAEMIVDIEADRVPISANVVVALHEVFAFDRHVLVQLIAIYAGGEIAPPAVCRCCGCSWDDPCHDEEELGCGWRSPAQNLCTACPDPTVGDPAAIALPDRSAEALPASAALVANFDRVQTFAGAAH